MVNTDRKPQIEQTGELNPETIFFSGLERLYSSLADSYASSGMYFEAGIMPQLQAKQKGLESQHKQEFFAINGKKGGRNLEPNLLQIPHPHDPLFVEDLLVAK